MSGASVMAALLWGLAVWGWVGPRPVLQEGARTRRQVELAWPGIIAAVGLVLVGAVWLDGLRGFCWAGTLLAVVGTVGWLVWQEVRARRRQRAQADVARAMRVLSGQLRIGAVPARALARAAEQSPALEHAAATLTIGGDVTRALRTAAEVDGREGLLSLARGWELCERTGAPIAALAAQVSEQTRTQRAASQLVASELAGPRATARLLALLPLLGILLGRIAGGDPVSFLLGTAMGQLCLLAGVVLACVGVLATEHMAAAAERI